MLILYPASDIPALSQKLIAEQENGYISYGSVASMCEDKALTDAELKRLSSLFSSAEAITPKALIESTSAQIKQSSFFIIR